MFSLLVCIASFNSLYFIISTILKLIHDPTFAENICDRADVVESNVRSVKISSPDVSFTSPFSFTIVQVDIY